MDSRDKPRFPSLTQPFSLEVLRAAELRDLAAQPLSDPDRLGRYASLLMENLPPRAVILCLLDTNCMLLEKHVLASGPLAEMETYVPLIPTLYRRAGAFTAALLFAPRTEECGYTKEDERFASQITFYCRREKVRLLECVFAGNGEYVPLYRHLGYTFTL